MHYKGQVGTFLVAEANNKQHKLMKPYKGRLAI